MTVTTDQAVASIPPWDDMDIGKEVGDMLLAVQDGDRAQGNVSPANVLGRAVLCLDRRARTADVRVTQKLDELRADMNTRFDTVNQRFHEIDKRFEAVDRRFEAVESKIDALDAKFERKFDALETKFERKFEVMETKFDRRFEVMETKFDLLADDVRGIAARLERLLPHLLATEAGTPASDRR